MKIICTRDNLASSLSLVGGIASKNINLPILNNVLIKAENQKISLIATNLELAITSQLRAKIEEPGSFTVPAKTLNDFVNLLTEETVELEVENNELKVKSGKSETKIKGTVADEFPVLPPATEGTGFLINIDELKDALGQVNPASAKNEIRPELAGTLFHFNPNEKRELVLAATDSYRLAEKKIKLEQGEDDIRIIVPARTAQEMGRILTINKNVSDHEKGVRLIISESQIVMRNNDVELISRLVEGKYPDYTQIIPSEFRTTVEINVSKLIKAVKAASLFTTTGVNAVTFDLKKELGMVGISSASAQAGEHVSDLTAEIEGENNNIILNHRYVLEGLSNFNADNCLFKVVNADSPCVFTSKDNQNYLYIVMPIRQ